MGRLQLVSLDDERVRASDISRIVAAPENADLALDFPALYDRWADPDDAEASLERVRGHIARDMGGFAAMAVQMDGVTRGLITAEQAQLESSGWRRRIEARGPLIAYWLDERRPLDERHRGVAAVQALAHVLKTSKPDMDGFAWTVVRPANRRSARVLEDEDNGFGGFEPVGERQRWNVGDGVRAERQLYVARFSMEQLRQGY